MTSDMDWEPVIEGWGTPKGLSEHAWLAAGWDSAAGPCSPVPGCGCPRCAAYAAGATPDEAFHVEELVKHLAPLPPEVRADALEAARRERARLGLDPDLCPVRDGVLLELAKRVQGSLQAPSRMGDNKEAYEGDEAEREPMPVEEARCVPIRQVAARLGLGEPTGRWGEPRVLCPLHDDHDPSLRLQEGENLWYCDVCAEGGDGIRLVEKALDLEFADATRWIANGGRAGKSGIVTTGGRR